MNPGKVTCDVLKKIRSEIAAANQIEYQSDPCSFKGACTGTCPKCESELQYLEHQLIKKHGSQKTALLAGVSLAIMSGFSSCKHTSETKSPVLTSDHSVFLQSSLEDSVPIKPVDSLAHVTKNSTFPVLKMYKNKVLIFEEKNDTVDFLSDTLQLDQISFQGTYVQKNPAGGVGAITVERENIHCLKHTLYYKNEQNLKKYLNNLFKFPSEKKIDKTIIKLQLLIDKTGKIKDVSVLKSLDMDIDQQIMKIIKNMPNWSPGEDPNGRPTDTRVKITLKVTPEKVRVVRQTYDEVEITMDNN